MRIHRQARVPSSAKRMYLLVKDIEAYPSFLPWCPQAEMLEQGPTHQVARLELARGGVHTSFTTRNTLVPGRRIDMELLDGPFRHLHGVWTFTDQAHGCQVELDIEFEVHGTFRALALPFVFSEVCNRLVHAFVIEARRHGLE